MKFGTSVCLKRWTDQGEFALDRAKIKNNIAENSVALWHETHNTYYVMLDLAGSERAVYIVYEQMHKYC